MKIRGLILIAIVAVMAQTNASLAATRAITNQSSRKIDSVTTTSTRRATTNRIIRGRAGTLNSIQPNKNNIDGNSEYVKMVIPSTLSSNARISKYMSLSNGVGSYILLRKTSGQLPSMGTFFSNMGIEGAYSDSNFTNKVIESNGTVVSGASVPGTIYAKLGSGGGTNSVLANLNASLEGGATVGNSNDNYMLINTADGFSLLYSVEDGAAKDFIGIIDSDTNINELQ